jgi:hypothetical protein
MRGKVRVLGAALLLEEVLEAMTVELGTSGRVLAMEFDLLKTRHPFFLILQILAGTTKRMNGSQWMVDLAAVMLTAMKTLGTRTSALTLAMRRLSTASLLRSREIMPPMLLHTVELLKLAATDWETDRCVLY